MIIGEYVKYSILFIPRRVLDYTTSACEVLNVKLPIEWADGSENEKISYG